MPLTNEELLTKKYKYGNMLIYACTILYTVLMAAKGVFTAEIAAIMKVFDTDKPTASLATTYYFLTYAVVQVILSFLIEKINFKNYLAITIALSGVCTALMGLATNIKEMWVIFAINGIFQAGMWGGIVYTMTKYLPSKLLAKGNAIINTGYAFGNVMAYALSAVCLSIASWKLPFFIAGGATLLAIVFYIYSVNKSSLYLNVPEESNTENDTKKENISFDNDKPLFILNNKKRIIAFYIIDLIASFLVTVPYYAIMNWIPSSLIENGGFTENIAIYITIIAPIVTLLGPTIAISACEKDNNFVRVVLKISLIMLPMPLLLGLLYKVHFIIIIVLSILYVSLANGIKAITLSVVAIKLRTQINAGVLGTLNNAVASVAAALTPTIIGAVIENAGWEVSYFVTFGISAVICLSILAILILIKATNKSKKGEI